MIRDYSGWWQSLKGTRFQIKDCTLFNLETPTGKKVSLGLLTHLGDGPLALSMFKVMRAWQCSLTPCRMSHMTQESAIIGSIYADL